MRMRRRSAGSKSERKGIYQIILFLYNNYRKALDYVSKPCFFVNNNNIVYKIFINNSENNIEKNPVI